MNLPSPLQIVLVGCGNIANSWLTPLAEFPDAQVVGLVDLNQDTAERLRTKYELRGAETGTVLAEMLERLQPDAVFDCTIPAAHRAVTLTALEHGCHVLGEKPMAENMRDARTMVEAAHRADKLYAVIQNRRYAPPIHRFRDFLRNGAIGCPHTFHADFFLGPHFGGFRTEMEHVLLLDMAIHSFDMARFLSDTDPVSVIAHDWNPPGSWFRHGASAAAIFEMSNGVTFSYRGSWCAEGLNTSWECAWRTLGTNGSATWNGDEDIRAQVPASNEGFIRPVRKVEAPPASPFSHTGHAALIREFLDALHNDTKPQTICTDNILSLAMVHAAIQSAEEGRRIFLAGHF